MIFPIVVGATLVTGIAWAYRWLHNQTTANNPGIPVIQTAVPLDLVGGVVIPSEDYMFTGPSDDIDTWPIVSVGGEQYRVAPTYIGPVGIGQAQQIAESRGFQLPTPALVDAIWRNADLHISPIPEASDGTPRTMASPAVYLKHKQKVDSAIDGRSFQLLGGSHKDIVIADTAQPGLKKGGIGLYGWHAETGMVKNGRTIVGGAEVHAPVTAGDGLVIQQPFGGHGLEWIDYSQGVRLVKKVTGLV